MGNGSSSKAQVGKDNKPVNFNDLAKDVTVNYVNPAGPFTEPAADSEDAKVVLATDLWKGQKAVIHMLRRFGCPLCRNAAVEISRLRPILDKHNIRLLGVGLGYDSLGSFMESKCWDGNDLYVDVGKDLYQAAGLGKGGVRQLLFSAEFKKMRKEAKKKDVGGNYSGDGMQLGATYTLSETGEILMEFQQQTFGSYPTLESILESLGLADEIPNIPAAQVEESKNEEAQ